MKSLEISKDNRVLEKKLLNKKTLLIGRSPHCDIVLRNKNIKHVHFILESLTDDLDSAAEQEWTVLDISEKQNNGFGVILNNQDKQHLNSYDFRIIEDKLAESEIAKGSLKRSLKPNETTTSFIESESSQNFDQVLEITVLKKDIDTVLDILHYSYNKNKNQNIQIPHEKNKIVRLSIHNGKKTFSLNKIQPQDILMNKMDIIPSDQIEKVLFDLQDFIQLETTDYVYFIRLLKKESIQITQKSFFSEKVTQALLISFVLLAFIIYAFNFLIKGEIKIKSPPPARVVTVEIKKVIPPEVPSTPEPMKEETMQEVAPKAEIAVSQLTNKASSGESRVIKNPEKPSKAGLNNTSQTKNINTVGILGKLKKSTGTGGNLGKVSADMVLNQGVISDLATGQEGNIVIKQGAMGQLGGKSKTSGSGNGLAEASTTLSGADVVDGNSAGSIAAKGGKSQYSMGEGSGNRIGGNSTNSNLNGGLSDIGGEGSMSVSGGLDKDAVRRAIAEHRRAIRNCYETALLTKSTLQGRLTYKWTISPNGIVTSIALQNSSIGYPTFEECIEGIIREIQFPIAQNKQSTLVIYPFVFQGKAKN